MQHPNEDVSIQVIIMFLFNCAGPSNNFLLCLWFQRWYYHQPSSHEIWLCQANLLVSGFASKLSNYLPPPPFLPPSLSFPTFLSPSLSPSPSLFLNNTGGFALLPIIILFVNYNILATRISMIHSWAFVLK